MDLIKSIVLVFFVFFLTSCSNSIDSEEEFLKWLNNSKNGLVKKQRANGFVMTMKYLPSEYLRLSNKSIKKNENNFDGSFSFLFIIEREKNEEHLDITKYGVTNMEGYKKRINKLNFEIKNNLYIKTENGDIIKPVLTSFQNNYEISDKESFYIVFQNNETLREMKDIHIFFEDFFLDTGINHFLFKKKNIKNLPYLNF